ncbi:hypothetical protein GF327_02825 [Candidatus Woesearchaeota archaeon]|nr:hypothetical protein [Candidatus Woesearchaeota archaeon]
MKIKKKIKKNKGLIQFIIRSGIFFSVLLAFRFFIFLYFRHTLFFLKYLRIDADFYLDFLTGLRGRDFQNAAMFTLALFVLWNRKKLFNLKPYNQNYKESAIFGVLAMLTQVFHYVFKYWIKLNLDTALNHSFLITLIKYSFNLFFILFLAAAAYNLAFIKEQFKNYKKQIPVFSIILIVYFFLIQFFQRIWRLLGNFVARAVYFLLSLSFEKTYLRILPEATPRLGVDTFIVGISKECSGIDSLLLFISLYSAIFVLDYKILKRKRMLLLLIPGLIGTVSYNILRVYLLLLVGVFISPEFAVDMFHSNIGWILFLLFFMAFWHFGSSRVYEKK